MLCFGSPAKDDDDFSSRKSSKSKSSDSRGSKKKNVLTRAASTPAPISIPPRSKNSLSGTLPLSAQPTSSNSASPFSTSPKDGKAATSAGSPSTSSPSGSTSSPVTRNSIGSKRLQSLKSARGLNSPSTPQAHPLPCPDSGPVPNATKTSTQNRNTVSAPTTPAPILIPKSPLGTVPAAQTPKGAPSPSTKTSLGRSGSQSSLTSAEASSAASDNRVLVRGQSLPPKAQDSPKEGKEGSLPPALGKGEGSLTRSSSSKEASSPETSDTSLPGVGLGIAGHTIPEEQGNSGPKDSNSRKATQNPGISFDKVDLSQLVSFSHMEMAEATEQFSDDCMVGEGGFGPVYQGWVHQTLLKGTGFVAGESVTSKGYVAVAIKILKADSHQGEREWLAEVSYLGHLRHPHLVRLLGYCTEGKQRMLVYEYMPQGSLEFLLFAPSAPPSPSSDGGGLEDNDVRVLTWHERITIALGAAKGLAFLHEEVQPGVIYRDFKTSNILLDDDLSAKLSDFGLARDGPQGDCTHVSTRIVGTVGYAAPEYVMTGHLTNKSDIYAFGVVLLELLTGRLAMDKRRPKDEQSLVEWAEPYLDHPSKLYRIMDKSMKGRYSARGAQGAAAVAKGCLNKRPKQRPKMSAVVKALEPLLDLHDMAGLVGSAPSARACPPVVLSFDGGNKLGRVLSGEGRGDGAGKGLVSPRQVVPAVGSARG